jgi:aminoglycoside 3-N-acetyltransferase
MVLLVHSSLRSLGWVVGGEVAVVLALEDALGPEGTLVMPTHSSDLTDPSTWRNPPVPESWWKTIRDEMPAFDRRMTPTLGMGCIPDAFRHQEGTVRSEHPCVSFAARGPLAEEITRNHSLAMGLGDDSPLGRIFEHSASVLLLGVGHNRNTSLHLAEARANWPSREMIHQGSPMIRDGRRTWVEYEDLDWDSTDFERIGGCFEADTALVRIGYVAQAASRLMPVRPLVRYAAELITRMRGREGT